MDPVVHFEIPVNDIQRAKAFYEKLFGWKITQWKSPDANMEYFMIETTKMGKTAINGGMMKRNMPGQSVTIYPTVKSIDVTLQKAVQNGGRIALPKSNIGDGSMGAVGAFFDTEGNLIGVHQMPAPKPAKKAKKKK